MKAMIFAAGLGTRLKPITESLPKALVPISNKTLLEHTIRKLQGAGINEAIVNIHYFADKIVEWADGVEWITTGRKKAVREEMVLHFSDERERLLETGGAVLHARRWLEGCGEFLIHNVDILSNCDLKWFESQVKDDALATLMVSDRNATRSFLFDPDSMRLVGWSNRITGDTMLISDNIDPKKCLPLSFAGIHILSDKVLQLMEEYAAEKGFRDEDGYGIRFPIKDFYLWAAVKHPIYGVVPPDLELLDVGKIDAIKAAEEFIERQSKQIQ